MGESFGAEDGVSPGAGLNQDPLGMSDDSRYPGFVRSNSLKPVGCPEVDSRIPVPVASVVQSDMVAHRKGGGGGECSQVDPPGNYVLPDCTSVIGRSGRSSGGGEGVSEY